MYLNPKNSNVKALNPKTSVNPIQKGINPAYQCESISSQNQLIPLNPSI